MPRTDDDSWDITHSVGSTALWVAAARAAETESEHPLIRDPFARMFLEAASENVSNLVANFREVVDLTEHDRNLRGQSEVLVDSMAVRTAFFDEFFLDAVGSGVGQVVILAAGLDVRAWRLPWPDGTTVYELDQASVLDFKSTTLQQRGARPTSNVVSVAVDLRQDWPKMLQEAGFDASRPTAWSAEGLLRYLPARAQDLLFERIHALSSLGSWLALNAPGESATCPAAKARERQRTQQLRTEASRMFDIEVPDFDDLSYSEERAEVYGWLREHGWTSSVTTIAELLARYGRAVPEPDLLAPTDFVSARRS